MRMVLCRNSNTRRKVSKRKLKVCDSCKKIRRLLGSYIFCTSKNWTYWSEKRHLWLIDWNDYRWICRDCIEVVLNEWEIEPVSKLLIGKDLFERRSLYVC